MSTAVSATEIRQNSWRARRSRDFTSAGYLGFEFARDALPRWQRFTENKPALISESSTVRATAREVGTLFDAADAMLSPSSLHALIDVISSVGPSPHVVVDEYAYPVGRVLACRAAGARVQSYRHHDSDSVSRLARPGSIVLTDSWCVACDRRAPLEQLVNIVSELNATLLVDDSQTLGLGKGGRSTAARLVAIGSRTVVVASVAKALGVPIAITAGSLADIKRIAALGPTRSHSSPVSNGHAAVMRLGMAYNRKLGPSRRAQLAGLAQMFSRVLDQKGKSTHPHRVIRVRDAATAQARCHAAGFTVLPILDHRGEGIAVLIRADHNPDSVIELATILRGETSS